MTAKSKLKKIQKKAVISQPVDPYASVHAKFQRVQELRAQIGKLKSLYAEYDSLMEQLIPYFVRKENDRFIVSRKLTIGTKTYNIHAYFYDEKKGLILSKAWKSAAHETFNVEELPASLI
jgi:hypothetical protein